MGECVGAVVAGAMVASLPQPRIHNWRGSISRCANECLDDCWRCVGEPIFSIDPPTLKEQPGRVGNRGGRSIRQRTFDVTENCYHALSGTGNVLRCLRFRRVGSRDRIDQYLHSIDDPVHVLPSSHIIIGTRGLGDNACRQKSIVLGVREFLECCPVLAVYGLDPSARSL